MVRNSSRRFATARDAEPLCRSFPSSSASPAEMRISTYAEGRFSRLDPLIESKTQGQCTCDINEPDG